MIPTTAHTPTLIKSSTPWNPALTKSTQPHLIAQWEKDSQGKLFCRWIKV